jgi:predicted DNA-binding protein (UPF0251 family)
MHCLDEVRLSLDEFEAVRLADHAGLYQEKAARRMKISRQTFGNIVRAARGKIAGALVNGRALRVEIGPGPHQGENHEALHSRKNS